MREWTEIAVDEDLLIPVIRELLDLAANPNQVEVAHGTNGRVIVAEVHLAEHGYQERLKREVVAPADKVVASAETPVPVPAQSTVVPMKVEPSKVAAAVVQPPARRVPAPKPSASLDGEEP